MIGYLVLLSVWLFESPLSVRDFLSESATLQAVIQPVAQSSGVDPLIQGLAAFLLGVAYEFDTDPGKAAVTRETMHPILHSRIGADQFACAHRPRCRRPKPEDKEKADEEAPGQGSRSQWAWSSVQASPCGAVVRLFFVEFWRANSTLISKTITVDPASSSAAQAAVPAELLDAQRQAEALRDTVAKQAREMLSAQHAKEIEALRSQLDTAETTVSSHAPQLQAAQTELEQLKSAHAAALADIQARHDALAAQLEETQARGGEQ
ncbi:hypothetical protein L1887_62971 [Cichorium endivia]|nr:hypothetical protein L1887_62971 [Cichorium endivia]